jgi:hypothetical protein
MSIGKCIACIVFPRDDVHAKCEKFDKFTINLAAARINLAGKHKLDSRHT